MTEARLVMITWLDSRQPNGSWQWLSEFEKMEPVRAASVGWLIQDDADVKVIAQSLANDGDDKQTSGRKAIPACCVQSIQDLSVPDLNSHRESGSSGSARGATRETHKD
jgi:hypothetical protein